MKCLTQLETVLQASLTNERGKGCCVFFFKDMRKDKGTLFVPFLACSMMAVALVRNAGEPG